MTMVSSDNRRCDQGDDSSGGHQRPKVGVPPLQISAPAVVKAEVARRLQQEGLSSDGRPKISAGAPSRIARAWSVIRRWFS